MVEEPSVPRLALGRWQMGRWLESWLICTMLLTGASTRISAKTVTAKDSILRGPYCGVCCVYAAIRLSNATVDFAELIQTKYIGAYKGSSVAELREATVDYGLFAEPVERLRTGDLIGCPYRVILHVRRDVADQEYDHYVLFLGTSNGQAKVFDAPDQVKLVSFCELASLWDGNGLVVASQPVDLTRILASSRRRFALWTVAILGLVLMIRWIRSRVPAGSFAERRLFLQWSLGQTAGLVGTGLLCGILYHISCDAGLLANAHVTTAVQKSHAGNFTPKANYSMVQRLLADGAVLVDARFRYDYKRGHIKRAICVPLDANDVERQEIMASIPKTSKLVIYCQSRTCPFAGRIAGRLQADGFSDLVIYRGGWLDWVAKNGEKNVERKL